MGFGYGFGDILRRINESMKYQVPPTPPLAVPGMDDIRSGLSGLRQDFDLGLRGIEPGSSGGVGPEGIPDRLRDPAVQGQLGALRNMGSEPQGSEVAPPPVAPEAMGIESGLMRADEAEAALARGTARRQMMQTPAPPPPSQVKATVNGVEYDYSNGRRGNAPLAGGQLGSMFGREWSNQPTDQTHEFAGQGNGSFSQMNELDPSMKTIGQLQDENALIKARPATQPGAPAGMTQGDVLEIQKQGLLGAEDPRARRAAGQDQLRAQAAAELEELGTRLRAAGANDAEIRTAQEAAARDLFLTLGLNEGELGALGSYLKRDPNAIALPPA